MEVLKIRPECLNCKNFSGGTPEDAVCKAKQNPTCYRKKKFCTLFAMRPAKKKPGKSAIAYTDGCYNKVTRKFGYGIVLITGGEEFVFFGSEFDRNGGWQIEGELQAALLATKNAIERGCTSLEIRYDYEGVEKWVKGFWRTKKTYTREYAKTMRKYSKKIDIKFVHITAHKGEAGNEKADDLAKYACGISSFFPEESVVNQINREATIEDKTKKPAPAIKPDILEGTNKECRKAIKAFYSKSKHGFKDFAKLKTYGLDCYSRLKKDDLDKYVQDNSLEVIKETFEDDEKAYCAAVRWCMRGLIGDDAVHKVLVDKEISENASRKRENFIW